MKGINHETYLRYFSQKNTEHAPGVSIRTCKADGADTRGDGSVILQEEEE